VVITGGSKGIGLACARRFLEEGARVGICSRSLENLEAARVALGETHVQMFAADLSDADAAAAMVDAMEAALGGIDVLVNSAGSARRMPPDELSPAAWRDAIGSKFFTYINVIDPVIKHMASAGRGVIVNIIGSGGKVAVPTHLPGGSANAALMLATAGLGAAYARRGVRVMGVNPGLTATERVSDAHKVEARLHGITEGEALQRSTAQLAIGRLAQPEEIAEVVVFLASDRASYLTAANITMDGGQFPVVV